jgi:hypothetical protein
MGGACGVISPLTSQGLEVDRVAKRVVGVDPSPGALRALSWAADEARRWLASRQLVHS